MEIIKIIVKVIIGCILTISLLGLITIHELETTILDKEFVVQKVEKNNYYDNLYSNIINDFKGYIGPSGFDEKILEEIITREEVKEDVKKVIDNIYSSSEKEVEIDTTELKERLNNNIDTYLEEENLKVEDRESIEEFENKVSEEYERNMTYSKYYKYAKKLTSVEAKNMIRATKGICIVGIVISIIGIIAVNYKKFGKILPDTMTILLTCGILIKIFTSFITKKINIDNITILNTSFSLVTRDIINEILKNLSKIGITLIITSLILIILGNTIFSRKDEKDV